MEKPKKKIDILREMMAAEEWTKALAYAARFPDLGAQKSAIKGGHEARCHERFYKSLGKDTDAMIAEGIQALKDRYPTK